MTRCACRVLYGRVSEERLPGLETAEATLYGALVAACKPSGTATVDLAEIAMTLRLRELTWRIALLGLRVGGRVRVEHSTERFETATVTLAEVGR